MEGMGNGEAYSGGKGLVELLTNNVGERRWSCSLMKGIPRF